MLANTTTERYHVLRFANAITRATVACHSICGPIHLTTQIGAERSARSVFFRTDSSVYNIQNSAVEGHEIIPLEDDGGNKRAVVAVTSTKTTRSVGAALISIALNSTVTASEQDTEAPGQEVHSYSQGALQPGESVTVHVVLRSPLSSKDTCLIVAKPSHGIGRKPLPIPNLQRTS